MGFFSVVSFLSFGCASFFKTLEALSTVLLCYADWSNNSHLYALDCIWAASPLLWANKWYCSIRRLNCPLWTWIVNNLQNISNMFFKGPLLHRVWDLVVFLCPICQSGFGSLAFFFIIICFFFAEANIAGVFGFSFPCLSLSWCCIFKFSEKSFHVLARHFLIVRRIWWVEALSFQLSEVFIGRGRKWILSGLSVKLFVGVCACVWILHVERTWLCWHCHIMVACLPCRDKKKYPHNEVG